MPSFNPRIWLREVIQHFPKWKQLFNQWLNAPSLSEMTAQHEQRLTTATRYLYREMNDRVADLTEQASSLNQRLSVLEARLDGACRSPMSWSNPPYSP